MISFFNRMFCVFVWLTIWFICYINLHIKTNEWLNDHDFSPSMRLFWFDLLIYLNSSNWIRKNKTERFPFVRPKSIKLFQIIHRQWPIFIEMKTREFTFFAKKRAFISAIAYSWLYHFEFGVLWIFNSISKRTVSRAFFCCCCRTCRLILNVLFAVSCFAFYPYRFGSIGNRNESIKFEWIDRMTTGDPSK